MSKEPNKKPPGKKPAPPHPPPHGSEGGDAAVIKKLTARVKELEARLELPDVEPSPHAATVSAIGKLIRDSRLTIFDVRDQITGFSKFLWDEDTPIVIFDVTEDLKKVIFDLKTVQRLLGEVSDLEWKAAAERKRGKME